MKSLLTAAVIGLTALPAAATDLMDMTDAEHEQFGALVRQYLLENPFILVEVSQILEEQSREAQENADLNMVADNSDALWNDPNSWVGGNPDGDVTLVEFIDYRCGYCRKAHSEVAELIESDGNIRIIMKEYPILGEQSVLASKFAISVRQIAGDDAYKLANDALIGLRSEVSGRSLKRLAETLELDADAILAHMDSADVQAVIDANYALGQRMQVSGTPTFVMNNELLRGYVPLDSMRQIVAELRG